MEISEIEAQRQKLEDTMQQLRQSLKHWQSWDAQYEGLKEELIATGPEDLELEGLLEISKSYDGDLVTEKEILDLAGVSSSGSTPTAGGDSLGSLGSQLRSRRQILGLIERRQDYVQKNIETLQKQYFIAEGKIEEFAFASVTASGVYGDGIGEDDEGGLPLTEIHEELDDEGNVISSELRRPDQDTEKVIERLRAAGLTSKDLGVEDGKGESALPIKSALVSPLPSPTKPVDPVNDYQAVYAESGDEADEPRRAPVRKKSVSFSADTKPEEEKLRSGSQEGRKSVSFAEKVAVARAADPPDTRSVTFSPQVEEIPAQALGPPSPNVQAISEATSTPSAIEVAPDVIQTPINADASRQQDLRASFKPGEKVYEIDEDAETTKPYVVLPENESEEDARTRREMLSYHLNEVNNVVAQMDLDDDYDDEDDEGDEGDEEDEHDSQSVWTASENQDQDTPYTSGFSDQSEDDEDEYGRSKGGTIPDDYRKEMEELSKRLIGNIGSAPQDEDIADVDPDLNPDDVRKLVIRDKPSSISSAAGTSSDADKKAGGKKRVSFAEELDVAQPVQHPIKSQKHVPGESVTPVSEGVVERTSAASPALPRAVPAEKVSRFKQARAPQPSEPDTFSGATEDTDSHMDSAPTGPPGVPLADTLVERAPSSKPAAAPDADEHDPLLARRQLAADYYRRRNDMVKEYGGFKGNAAEDEDLGELMEERADGKVKKVSRFKAARLGK